MSLPAPVRRLAERLLAPVLEAQQKQAERLNTLEAQVQQGLYRLRAEMLGQRRLLTVRLGRPRVGEAPPSATLLEDVTYESTMADLQRRAPRAFELWRKLLDVNAFAYRGCPADSCSVEDHPMADLFHCFLLPYWGGRALDIGCGPQPVPWYLHDYPLDQLYGIDPLATPEDHPFHFVKALAEGLPWADDQFDLVVAATSLDHVLLLDRTFEEVRRVLAPGGRFCVWVGFVEGAEPYDPYADHVEPVDDYHLFHFDRGWFIETIRQYFTVVERFEFDPPHTSAFFCLEPVERDGAR